WQWEVGQLGRYRWLYGDDGSRCWPRSLRDPEFGSAAQPEG
ncbi:hypothetical protein M8J76_012226, partial [Diaphorina citri]